MSIIGNFDCNGNEILSYEEWLGCNEEQINVEITDSGLSNQLDFDYEHELEKRYINYLNKF